MQELAQATLDTRSVRRPKVCISKSLASGSSPRAPTKTQEAGRWALRRFDERDTRGNERTRERKERIICYSISITRCSVISLEFIMVLITIYSGVDEAGVVAGIIERGVVAKA